MMSRVSSSRVTRPSLSRFGRPTASKSTVTLKYEQSRLMNVRSEEHTSELQSLTNLVCRLLLENGKSHASTSVTDHSSMSSSVLYTTKYVFTIGPTQDRMSAFNENMITGITSIFYYPAGCDHSS